MIMSVKKQLFNCTAYQLTAYGAIECTKDGGDYISPSAFDTSAVNDIGLWGKELLWYRTVMTSIAELWKRFISKQ